MLSFLYTIFSYMYFLFIHIFLYNKKIYKKTDTSFTKKVFTQQRYYVRYFRTVRDVSFVYLLKYYPKIISVPSRQKNIYPSNIHTLKVISTALKTLQINLMKYEAVHIHIYIYNYRYLWIIDIFLFQKHFHMIAVLVLSSKNEIGRNVICYFTTSRNNSL